jgi:xylulokinase
LWSEQDPRAWWQSLELAVTELRTTAPKPWAAVRAIGLSGQMHGAVALDAHQRVLRPAILWNDGRAFAECTELERAQPRSREITGNLAMPGFTAPKLLWLRRHEPEVFARVGKVLLPKDWLRLQLTGDAVSDMSDASGTLWLDVGARRWSEAMLAACGLSPDHMPKLVEGSAPSARLSALVADAWGLRAGLVVAGGGGDNAASAVGVGAVRPGQGFVSLGTSGVVFLARDAFRPAPERAVHAFAHAVAGRWHQMSVMLSAGSALAWAARLMGAGEAALAERAARLPLRRHAQAPLFLPYLSGERTPHNNPLATGVLAGLREEHDPADVAYAVMEGVSFGLKDGLAAMQSDAATGALALVGGGARSDAWSGLLASALGCVLHRTDSAHAAAAMGAARLAWLADGGAESDVCAAPTHFDAFEPDSAQAATLQARYHRFRALYPALVPHFADAVA